MFGNIIGKVLLGYLNDKSVALALTFGVACGIAGILMLMLIGATGVMALLIGGFLFGICYATTVTIPPMLTRTIFGSRQYGQIYSNIMMVASLCSALGASLWGFIADATGSFVASFSVAVCTSVIAIVVGLIALKAKKSVVMTKGSVA
jgi:MFS family permease